MSMLTPPGMGGKKYRITGNRYPRMSRRPRRRRKVFAAVAAVTALGLLGYGGSQLVDVFAGNDERSTQAQSGAECTPVDGRGQQQAGPPPELPEAESITVNIYNATTRQGLAQRTADALADRGFSIGDVANAPGNLDGKVRASGLLMGPPRARDSGAREVLGAHVAGAVTREADVDLGEDAPASGDDEDGGGTRNGDGRDGAENGDGSGDGGNSRSRPEVDLVLGDGFTELARPRQATQELEHLREEAAAAAEAAASAAPGCAEETDTES